MLNEPTPYRWQDHVISPTRAASNLIASAAVALVFGSALAFACVRGPTAGPPDPPSTAHAAVSERTPPLCQLVKRPEAPQHADPRLHRL